MTAPMNPHDVDPYVDSSVGPNPFEPPDPRREALERLRTQLQRARREAIADGETFEDDPLEDGPTAMDSAGRFWWSLDGQPDAAFDALHLRAWEIYYKIPDPRYARVEEYDDPTVNPGKVLRGMPTPWELGDPRVEGMTPVPPPVPHPPHTRVSMAGGNVTPFSNRAARRKAERGKRGRSK